jgi:hypothetical protein
MMLFAWKAAVFPAWGSTLFVVAVAVIASHVMLRWFNRFSWRSKGLLSVSAAIIAGGVMLGFGPPHRQFDLFRANLSGHWLLEENLRKANLELANLRDANLSGADLSGADLSFANLSGANLSRANLSGADLGRANLSGADLVAASLSGAALVAANLSGADLNKADLSGANLIGADLSKADLSGAFNLTQRQLDKACGNSATKLWPWRLTLKPCSTD